MSETEDAHAILGRRHSGRGCDDGKEVGHTIFGFRGVGWP